MNRTVYVARTAHDQTHVNRLAVPEFALTDFRLVAGAKKSRFHQPDDAPAPVSPESGAADFHFVPEHETIEMRYTIQDRFGIVKGAKLEVFTGFESTALWTLDLKELGENWWAHGKHAIRWDGRVVKPTAEQAGTATTDGFNHDLTTLAADKTVASFPDGYVTLEHTPYKLRLTLTADAGAAFGNPEYGWTFFQILLKGFELELGAESMIPAVTVDDEEHKRNKALRTAIASLPAAGATKKIMLISNIFKTASAEMSTNAAYDEYKTAWKDGPQIPIVAKIRLSASDDAEVKIDETAKGAVALGKVKFLWDWEDPDESVAGMQHQPKPRAFIEDAIKYYNDGTDATRSAADHTYPKGDNCHVDRGGKRGPAAKPVFPPQAGYVPKTTLDAGKFPFKVEASAERKWSSLSHAWTSGSAKGKTGIIFQPSRMAGDDYKVTVYLAYEKSAKDKLALNIKDEPLVAAPVLKKETGKFQVWRELHLVRYIRKKSTIGDFIGSNLAIFRGNYNESYVEIENKILPADNYEVPVAGYNGLATARLTGAGDALLTLAFDPLADHTSVASTFLMRAHDEFKTAVEANLVATGSTPATLAADLNTWLVTNAVQTPVKYCNKLNLLLNAPAKALVNDLNTLAGARNGITVIQFQFLDSNRAALDGTAGLSTLNGSAVDVPGASRNKCCFILWNPMADTFVHEIGHHLFLPHFGPKPDVFQADFHDSADLACIMSYNRPRPTFCGFCQLRMRGWDQTKLDPTSANNKKP